MIRTAKIDDIDEIVRLGTKLVNSGAYRDTVISYRTCVERLALAIRSPDQWLGVAVRDGKVVGFLLLQVVSYWWSANDRYVLDDGIFCTSPGMGRSLVKAGVQWAARQRGVREVMLALTSQFQTDRSVRALAHCGFRERGVVVATPNLREAARWVA